ncbi:MAG TPA: hypothetical protein VFQ76_19615 [Longimicrobiaceae bacterium]|nr:hypothetical protein [Longimicrobiaceae bacterium]
MNIQEIADELNLRSSRYRVGSLQEIRQRLRGSSHNTGHKIFSWHTIKSDYAFHFGGRTELQFNVGFEAVDGASRFRHGVAFSLEPGINLKDVSILFPQIRKFNEFLRLYPDEFADMALWFWWRGNCSPDLLPGAISEETARTGTFICLGKHYSPTEIDYEVILQDFDRLLPLYEFALGSTEFPEISRPGPGGFQAGHQPKAAATLANRRGGQINVSLRHNLLQDQLHRELSSEYGSAGVRTEYSTALGTRIDTVVQDANGKIYYEIKTGSTARSCIREALSQLLEYAFWPGAEVPTRLVIVGEPTLDADAAAYLGTLKSRFRLDIEYRQIVMTA